MTKRADVPLSTLGVERGRGEAHGGAERPGETQPPGSLVYLYAVVEAGSRAHQALAAGEIAGLDPAAPLFAVEAAGLAAAVSYVPAALFAEEPLNALVTDLQRLTPFAVRHEAAIARLQPHAPALVPLTFGAVYERPERVRLLLAEQATAFHAMLDRVRGRQEWGIKVSRNMAQSLAAVGDHSEELRRLAAEAAAASPGRAFILNKQRQRILADEADRMVAAACNELLEELAAVSAAARRDQITRLDTVESVQLALKAAFLVDETAADRFRALAGALNERIAPRGLRLELSGPWAPYSFVGAGDAG